MHDSYVKECLILPRVDEAGLFEAHSDGHVVARLLRYAVIPLEEYRRLKDLEIDIVRAGIALSRTKDGVRWRVH